LLGVFLSMAVIGLAEAEVASQPSVLPLDYVVESEPFLYNNAFYLFADGQRFLKTTLQGQEEWSLVAPKGSELVDIRFDRIYFLSAKGHLFCYEAGYGYKIWGPLHNGIRAVLVHYPVIVLLEKTGNLVGIDFFTGQELWRNKTHTWSKLLPQSNRNHIFAISDKQLGYLNIATGTLERALNWTSIDGRTKKLLLAQTLPNANKGYRYWHKGPRFAIGTTEKVQVVSSAVSEEISKTVSLDGLACKSGQFYRVGKQTIAVCQKQILTWQ